MPWPPRTETELQAALDQGLLGERHGLDIKRELGSNRSLAIDVAAMALDGGLLIIGVGEDADHRPDELVPVRLAGVRERIDSVTHSSIDPPVTAEIIEIEAVGDGLGYVIIDVPSSPAGPHQAAEKYRGRGDNTNRVLTDADVVRLHALRRDRDDRLARLLDDAVAADPVPAGERKLAHLHVVAAPVSGEPGMFSNRVDPPHGSWTDWMNSNILGGPPAVKLDQEWSPDIRDGGMQVSPHPDGWVLQTYGVRSYSPGQALHEEYMLEVLITDDGAVRLFSGRGSDFVKSPDAIETGDARMEVVLEVVVLGLALRALLVARAVGDAMGYRGQWFVGFALQGAGAARSYAAHQDMFAFVLRGNPLGTDSYRRTAAATTAELYASPGEVVRRVTDNLTRALNSSSFVHPPSPPGGW